MQTSPILGLPEAAHQRRWTWKHFEVTFTQQLMDSFVAVVHRVGSGPIKVETRLPTPPHASVPLTGVERANRRRTYVEHASARTPPRGVGRHWRFWRASWGGGSHSALRHNGLPGCSVSGPPWQSHHRRVLLLVSLFLVPIRLRHHGHQGFWQRQGKPAIYGSHCIAHSTPQCTGHTLPTWVSRGGCRHPSVPTCVYKTGKVITKRAPVYNQPSSRLQFLP